MTSGSDSLKRALQTGRMDAVQSRPDVGSFCAARSLGAPDGSRNLHERANLQFHGAPRRRWSIGLNAEADGPEMTVLVAGRVPSAVRVLRRSAGILHHPGRGPLTNDFFVTYLTVAAMPPIAGGQGAYEGRDARLTWPMDRYGECA